MIDADHELSLTRQAALLALSRSSLYYEPMPVSDAGLALMRRIDELHLELRFAGSRLLRDLLQGEGHAIGRYVTFYNTRRPHTALDRRTPDAVYFKSLPLAAAA